MNPNYIPITTLIPLIHQWGKDKGLHDTTDLNPQFVKLAEELGEMAAGIARCDHGKIMDSAGDMIVVLIQLGAIHNAQLQAQGLSTVHDSADYLTLCFNHAWDEIKDRKGKTKSGVFVKEE